MDNADRYFLGQAWYPYYPMSPPDTLGPSAYTSAGAVSNCQESCENQYAPQVDFNQEGFFHFNQCINQCVDLSKSKTRYGLRGA